MSSKGQSKRRRDHQFNTLTPLIRYFVGLELWVELKNGKSYNGYLQEGDDDMNLVLTTSTNASNNPESNMNNTSSIHASSINDESDTFKYSKLHIRGSSIRYIHFPDNVDLAVLIKIGIDRQRAATDKYTRGKRQKR
jgi:small nuclear ribonucleoprotein (snRNP)-like protein